MIKTVWMYHSISFIKKEKTYTGTIGQLDYMSTEIKISFTGHVKYK